MNQLNAENFQISPLSLNQYINQAHINFLNDVKASIKEMWTQHISVLNVELISNTPTITLNTYTKSDFSISVELQILPKDLENSYLTLSVNCPLSGHKVSTWVENNKNLSPDSISATILCYC